MASSSECPPESVKAEVLREFCASSSIHGIRYFDRMERTSCERFWWIVVFLLSLTGCGYLIFQAYLKWDQNPIIISTSEKTTPVWEVPFPAVTICPGVKVSPMKLNITKRMDELREWDIDKDPEKKNLTAEAIAELKTVAHVCDYIGGMGVIERLTDGGEKDVVKRLKKYSFDRQSLLRHCFFKFTFGEDYLKEIVTDEGLCYSFNLLPEDIVFRKEALHGDYTYMENWSHIHYSNDHKPMHVSAAGRRAGLQLLLLTLNSYIDQNCNNFPSGFHLIFHEPSTYPQVSKRYINIPEGHIVSVAVKPQIINTSDSAASYHWSKRQCFFNHERHLKFFKIYNQENCELECLTNITVTMCGCAYFWMPRAPETAVCSVGKYNCYADALGAMSGNMYYRPSVEIQEILRMYNGKETASKCNCLPSCSSVQYDTEISILAFNTSTHRYNFGSNSYSPTLLDVYFKESQFITSRRSELYGFVDFLSNCGGLLGLFMGFSVLSLLEICYFFTIRPLSLRKKRKISKQKAKKEASIKRVATISP